MTIFVRKLLLTVFPLITLAGCKADYTGFEQYRTAPLEINRGIADLSFGQTTMGPWLAAHPTDSFIVKSDEAELAYRFSYFGDRFVVQFYSSPACVHALRAGNINVRNAYPAIKDGTFLTQFPTCADSPLQSVGVFAATDPEDNFYQGYANGVKLYASYKDTLTQIGDPQSMSYTLTAAPAKTTYSEDRYPGLWIYHDLSQVKGMVIYSDIYELTKNRDAFESPVQDTTQPLSRQTEADDRAEDARIRFQQAE